MGRRRNFGSGVKGRLLITLEFKIDKFSVASCKLCMSIEALPLLYDYKTEIVY